MFCERQDSVQRGSYWLRAASYWQTSKLLHRRRTRSPDACETMWEFRDSGTGPLESTDLCPTTCPRTRGCRGNLFSLQRARRKAGLCDTLIPSRLQTLLLGHTASFASETTLCWVYSNCQRANCKLLGPRATALFNYNLIVS